MGKYTTIKCWYLTDSISDPDVIMARKQDLLLIKKSILKLGFRAFAVDDGEAIEKQPWYSMFLMGDEVRFYIYGSGVYRLVNCDLTESELYFERLDVPIGHKPWIFYSWQSDHNSSRSAIGEALSEAVKYINSNLKPRQQLEIVESLRSEDGAKDIVAAIKDNLSKCMFAVFDITNVATVKFSEVSTKSKSEKLKSKQSSKSYPNANVIFEFSYALTRKQHGQIVLVKKKRRSEFMEDRVPFDFEHNRRIDYAKPAQLKEDLKGILIDYFRSANYIKSE